MECQNAQKSSPGVVKKRPSGFKDIVKKTEVKAETEEMQTQTFTAIKKSELKVETDADVFQVDILNAAAAEDDLSYEGKNEYMNEDEIESNCDGEGISITDSVDEFEDESDDTDQAPLKKRKLNSASQGKKSIKKTNCDESRDGDYKNLTENLQQSSSAIGSEIIKDKIASGEYKIVTKIGKSKVWQIFGHLEMNGIINNKIVVCRICKGVYRLHGTSVLVRHKCFKELTASKQKVDVDQHTKLQVAKAITHWTINNCRPFKIVEDEGLLKYTELILSIGAKYGAEVEVEKLLPHPTLVSENVDKLYKQAYELLQAELNDIHGSGFAITTDLWTDNYTKTSYLALTIHFVKNAKLYTKLLGFQSMNSESCTNEKILRNVTNILQKFSCSLDKGMIVTNRASQMKAVFSGYHHIFSFNHLLHKIVERAIKETSSIEDLNKKCTQLVKYLKKSSFNVELTTTTTTTLEESFTPTRWNTTYFLLQSIHQNWSQIVQLLQEKTQLHRISGINVNLMKMVIDVLKRFAETSEKLEDDSHPTLHLAIIHVHFLKRLCQCKSNEDKNCLKEFKEKLNSLLSEVVMQNFTIFHKIALFLFPPTNKMLQFSSDEKEDIRKHCKDMMVNFSVASTAPVQNKSFVMSLSTENERLFAGFLPSRKQTNAYDNIQAELCAYENVNEVLYDSFDVLLWWKLNKSKFPLLYQVSCKIFATPASSDPSERFFSAARNLLCEKRSIIGWNSTSVEKIMFLHHNMKTIDNESSA